MVLLVGVTVTLGMLLLALITVAPVEPAPTAIIVSDGTVAADAPGDEDQRLCLRNRGPDPLPIDEITIGVRVPGADRSTRIVGLPPEWPALSADGYRGDDLIDRRSYKFSGVFGPSDQEDVRWASTERGCLRIKHGGDGVRLDPGDRVVATVVHRPSNAVVGEVTVRAR